jgi:aminoglycoside phosphotransferase family enzyme
VSDDAVSRTAAGNGAFDSADECPLAAKVAYLRRPGSYSPPPTRVEALETHMSWVFLTDLHAWKLKKPVRREFLDFSTVAARKANCEAELRLNDRLAPQTYLAVVPLAVTPGGALALGGAGRPVDWLVQMRRLPRERMLDAVIAGRAVTDSEVTRIASVLAAFYRSVAPVPMPVETFRGRLAEDVEASRRALAEPGTGLPPLAVDGVVDSLRGFIDAQGAMLAARLAAGRIVEGHGDLRPEHVCLLERPVVIDCIEFNRDFRILDVADELAFLALECERLGAADVGTRLFAACSAAIGDRVPPALVHFYAAARALLRAKLAAWHVADVPAELHGEWNARARRYFALAARHAEAIADPAGPRHT